MSEAAILERRAWFLWISLGIASWSTGIPTNPVEVLPLPTPGIISELESVEKNRSAVAADDDNEYIDLFALFLPAAFIEV
mmetsp:Transcript_32062/g.38265  ORF Transcript_32062/g.38265 Transcript_32062/m.38265 type:complete len:80 (-) Transcript_32062:364-603(-)